MNSSAESEHYDCQGLSEEAYEDMARIFSIVAILLMALVIWSCGGCTDRDEIDRKSGVSLPPVEQLQLAATADGQVKLSWKIPSSMPEEIQQPVSVYIDIREVVSATQSVPAFSTTLPDAPTEFTVALPDPAKSYELTVKLMGYTDSTDPNHSNGMYSPGETVMYAP